MVDPLRRSAAPTAAGPCDPIRRAPQAREPTLSITLAGQRARRGLRPSPVARLLRTILAAAGLLGALSGSGSWGRAHAFSFDLPLSDLTPRRDAILSDLRGTVGPGMLGRAHSLAADEDLHFSLRAPSIETAVVCEAMNVLSILPMASGPHDWHSRWKPLFDRGSQVSARGVFRVWPDHVAGIGGETEGTATSNPPHVVELHPLAALTYGSTTDDLRPNIAPITLNGQEYPYKDARQWGAVLNHTIATRPVQK